MDIETSLCIRCGKERVKKTEKIITVNSSRVKLTIYVCPDKKCQKIVEAQLAAKQARRLALSERRSLSSKKKSTN